MTVAFDARMAFHSGIGTHIRGLAGGFAALRAGGEAVPDIAWLGLPAAPGAGDDPFAGAHVPWAAPIYSPREQLLGPPAVSPPPDLWHFPHYNVPWRLPRGPRGRRAPLVVTVHDLIHLLVPEVMPSRARRAVARAIMANAIRRADVLLAVSEHTRRDLGRVFGVDPGRVTIVPNAVDPAFRPVGADAVEALRSRLGLPARFFLAVGIAKPHKRLDWLVEAFAAWTAEGAGRGGAGPDGHHLVLCGPTPGHAAPLLAMAAAAGVAGRVHAVGALPFSDLPALYQAADALVFPSSYEGFGLPVLEAQRLGTPVVCSDAACLPEVAGDGALMFDWRDRTALRAALDRAANLPAADRAALVARGHANEARFGWTESARLVTAAWAGRGAGAGPTAPVPAAPPR